MNSIKTNPDMNRSTVLKDIEKRLKDEQRRVELAILESKQGSENGLEELWQERDSPSEDEIREVEFHHRAKLMVQWREIEDALERLTREEFGRCLDCGKKIATKRLFANPKVARCLPCQTSIEGEMKTPSL